MMHCDKFWIFIKNFRDNSDEVQLMRLDLPENTFKAIMMKRGNDKCRIFLKTNLG